MAVYDRESFTLEDLRAMRKTILEQIAAGVASWSYNGQTFTYSDPDKMRKVVDDITREIRWRMAEDLGYQPVNLKAPFVRRPLSEGN